MEESKQVLTRDKAEKEFVLPTGRKVGPIPVRGSGLFTLGYVDGKPGKVPQEYQGNYTGLKQAEKDAQRFVKELWDISDRASTKKPLAQNNAVSR